MDVKLGVAYTGGAAGVYYAEGAFILVQERKCLKVEVHAASKEMGYSGEEELGPCSGVNIST